MWLFFCGSVKSISTKRNLKRPAYTKLGIGAATAEEAIFWGMIIRGQLSCWDEQMSRGNCPGGNYLRDNYPEGNFMGRLLSGVGTIALLPYFKAWPFYYNNVCIISLQSFCI